MHPPLRLLVVVSLLVALTSCDRTSDPQADDNSATEAELARAHEELAKAQLLMERQAFEMENRSALVEKQLAEMQAALSERDNAELRESLEALTRQNEELEAQASAARTKSETLALRLEATPVLRAEPIPVSNSNNHSRPVPGGQSRYEEQNDESLPHDYTMFYEGLAPHGRWVDIDGYGHSWQPRVASNRGWRPYLDGSWSWTDYGWAWNSNEPFGWATYHYGRWVNLNRVGWAWVPDSEWAPAWVSWRQTSDYVGWAPLPPGRGQNHHRGADRNCDLEYDLGPSSYTFITTNRFVSESYTNHYAPMDQNPRLFRRSVNTTRIVPHRDYENGRGHSHRSDHSDIFVQQGGPSRLQVESACRTRVPQREVYLSNDGHAPHSNNSNHSREKSGLSRIVLPLAIAGGVVIAPKIVERFRETSRVDSFADVPKAEAASMKREISRDVAKVTAREKAAVAAVPEVVAPVTPATTVPILNENVQVASPAAASGSSSVELPTTPPSSPAAATPAVTTADNGSVTTNPSGPDQIAAPEASSVIVAESVTVGSTPPVAEVAAPALPLAETGDAAPLIPEETQSGAMPAEQSTRPTEVAQPDPVVDTSSAERTTSIGETIPGEATIGGTTPGVAMPADPVTAPGEAALSEPVTDPSVAGETRPAETINAPETAMPANQSNDPLETTKSEPPVETPAAEKVNAPDEAMPAKQISGLTGTVEDTPVAGENAKAEAAAAKEAAMEATQRQAEERAKAEAAAAMEATQRQAEERDKAEAEAAKRAAMEATQRQAEERARAEAEAVKRAAMEATQRQTEERARAEAEAAKHAAMEAAQRQAEERARAEAAAAQRAANEAAQQQE